MTTEQTPTTGWTTVIDGIDFGEGPRWRNSRLWFSDFYQGTISSVEVHPDGSGTRHVEIEYDGRPSGLGWLPDGRLVFVSMLDRTLRRVENDGSIVLHADLGDIATGHCNDMVMAADGTAYVGNFGFDLEAGGELAAAYVAIARTDGSVERCDHPLAFPNGSVITPDGATLIVGESFAGQYTAFTIAPDGGLSEPRVWAQIEGTAPDGCALDAAGAIWFADAVGRQVVRVERGGIGVDSVTDRITTPNNTYACMLGGDDGQTLFVLICDDAHPSKASGTATGSIVSTRVVHAAAGRP